MPESIKLSKAGYPEEVTIVEASDMCRNYYHKNKKSCLTGWINVNFPAKDTFILDRILEDDDDFPKKERTKANLRAREILFELIIKKYSKVYNGSIYSTEDFNDTISKKLKLSLGYLAKLYNTMLYKIGYDVPKKYRLDEND